MNGWYEWHCTPSDMENFRASEEMQARVFKQLIPETMKRWVSYATEALRGKKIRLFMLPGNDDDFVIDEALTGSEGIVNPEGKVVMIDDEHEMISTGFTNITPWHAERDIPEDELAQKIEGMTSKVKNMKSAIFNFHCPPYGTMLDAAPKVDEKLRPVMSGGGVVIAPAGSTAVRAAIEKCQPLLGLHGHIHESRGLEKIGRTLCINPGSEYGEGILHGCIVNLGKDDIKSYLFTRG
jgi:Icc-related predicted phosphoesterase